MNDLPGPYKHVSSSAIGDIFTKALISLRKWFMLALGPENMHKMLAGFDDKSTQAVCTFGYSEGPGHEPIIFQGRTDVIHLHIITSKSPSLFLIARRESLCFREDRLSLVSDDTADEKRGARTNQKGWDSAFEYEGQTYAEMDKAEKNKVSHRGKALAKLKEWLAQEA